MADLDRSDVISYWGAAEQAAIDRCLSVPGLSLTRPAAPIRLTRMIEAEIIPRLLLAHLPEPEGPDSSPAAITNADVIDFTSLVLKQGAEAVLDYVDAVRARGRSLEDVLLDLFAPTARLLGDMWSDDLCTFTDVTISLCRLQQAMRAICADADAVGHAPCGQILLAPMPGDQHSFGISMLEGFFQRAGWDVHGGRPMSRRELMAVAKTEWLDVIGLSLSSDFLYDDLQRFIAALRRASRNPSVFVMLGGRHFLDHPGDAAVVGADAVASDAPDALRQAGSRLSFSLARC